MNDSQDTKFFSAIKFRKCGGRVFGLPVTVQKILHHNTIADNIVYYSAILLALTVFIHQHWWQYCRTTNNSDNIASYFASTIVSKIESSINSGPIG